MVVEKYKVYSRKNRKSYSSQLKNFSNSKYSLLNKFKYDYKKYRKVNRRIRKFNKKFTRNFGIFLKLNNLLYKSNLKEGFLIKNKIRSYKNFIIRYLRLNIKRKLLISQNNNIKFKRRYLNLILSNKFSKFNLLVKHQLLRQKKINKLKSTYFINKNLINNFGLLNSFYHVFKHCNKKYKIIKNGTKGFNKFYYIKPFFKKRKNIKVNKNFRVTRIHLDKKHSGSTNSYMLKFDKMNTRWYSKLRSSKINFNRFLSPFYNRFNFLKDFNTNNEKIAYFFQINRKLNKQIKRLNKPFYNNYNSFYLNFINNFIKKSFNSNIASRYSLSKFVYNKRRTKFLKYKGVYLGRSKYRNFSLIKNNLLLLKNKENSIKKNNFSLSHFYYNNLLNLNKLILQGYDDIRGKYVQRKAGHWWRMPWHRQKKWWKLKGKSNLALFNKSFIKLKKYRSRFNKKKKDSFIKLKSKRRTLKVVLRQATNNYFINVMRGDKSLFMITAGMVGFKGPKRRSWFAAQQLSKQVAHKILKRGSKTVDLEIRSEILSKHSNEVLKGLLKVTARAIKKGKKFNKTKSVLRSLKVNTLTTVYSRSHNGLRKRKSRRL